MIKNMIINDLQTNKTQVMKEAITIIKINNYGKVNY
jgi:hypothetical protein